MLALRLVRGSHAAALLGRLTVACATAGSGFLLLTALSYAVSHPETPRDAVVRLLWCVPPLAAVVQLAVAVARAQPGSTAPSGLDAAGIGPARLPMLAAVSTAVSCLLGSALAFGLFLHLRGEISGLPFDGAAASQLAAEQPLPVAAALTLLCLAPAAAAGGSALAMRERALRAVGPAARPEQHEQPEQPPRREQAVVPAPSGLPWGVSLVAAGLTLVAYAGRISEPVGGDAAAADRLHQLSPGVLGGWLLAALGLAVAGPGVVHLCGRVLSSARPGALRLIAGRGLQEEAQRLGQPLGVLCAVGAGAVTAVVLHGGALWRSGALWDGVEGMAGALAVLGAGLVVCCAALSAVTAAAESRAARAATREALNRLGAPRRLLRGAVALRATVLLGVVGVLGWVLGNLAALPLK